VQLYARQSVSYPPWQSRIAIPLTQAHFGVSCYPSPVVQASIASFCCFYSCTFKVHRAVAKGQLRSGVSLALVSPRYVPAAAKAHAVTGADPTIRLNLLEESMHATLERDTPAVVFRNCLFSQLLIESTHQIVDNYIATKTWLPFSRSRTPGAYEASLPNCLWRRDYCWFFLRRFGSQKHSVQVWSNGERSFLKRSISVHVRLR
jgi:hypothetical protein